MIQNIGPDQTDLLLAIQAEQPITGLIITSGLPPLDELWANKVHEATELHPGQLIQLTSIEHPKGGIPQWAEAYLLCRRS